MRVVAEGLRFPEGPVALKSGRILGCEIQGQNLAEIEPTSGTVSRTVHCGGGPNGAAIGPDGALYVCNNGGSLWRDVRGLAVMGLPPADYEGGFIQRVELDEERVHTLYTHCEGERLKGPNDIVFDATGGFWFTDMGKSWKRTHDHGGVYYARADGSSIQEVLFPLLTPNGIALSPDGKELYVAETLSSRVWAGPVMSPGKLGKGGSGPRGGRLVYGFGGYQLLDSMAVDAEGYICVATLLTSAISVVKPDGQLIDQVLVPGDEPFITNICFGGDNLRTAYITGSGRGRLYATEWRCPGLRLPFER